MPSLDETIGDEILALIVDLMRVSVGTRRRILGFFRVLEEDLVELLETLEGGSEIARMRRVRALLKRVDNIVKTAERSASEHLKDELIELSDLASRGVQSVFASVVSGSVLSTVLTRKDLEILVSDVMIRGAPSADWWAKQSANVRLRFASQVRMGIAAGETNPQIIERVLGRPTGKKIAVEIDGKTRMIPEYGTGVMNSTYREAEALVRTSVQTVANKVILETYKGNEDVIKGVMAVATLDHRTTLLCISRDGAKWSLTTGEPLPGSRRNEHFPGPPPWHWRCRTILIPLTYTWAELIEKASGKKVDTLEKEMPVSTRAALGGPVSSSWRFEDWLQRRSAAEQRDILGDARWRLWKDGKISLAQMTDVLGRPVRVEALRARRGLVDPVPK